jgi:ubiquinone biosynthesis protein Coq4
MEEENLPYLQRGRQKVETTSTALISSSKYLNDYRIREWVVNQSLKRNGRDMPSTYGIPMLIEAVREVQDHDRIETLFNEARRTWPEFDRWLDERWLSKIRRDDMKACPEGSIGGIWYKQLVDAKLEVDIIPSFEPRSGFEYFFLRGVQIHDFMHILGGGGFNSLGELIPSYLKFGNLFRWFQPELAGLLNVQNTLLSMPTFMRGALHYPELFMRMWDLAEHGMKVGRKSEALFLHRYEDWLDLPLEKARRKFGVRGAHTIDTTRESAFWDERVATFDPEPEPEQIAAE